MEDEKLFANPLCVVSHGVIVAELYDVHRGLFHVTENVLKSGNIDNLTDNQKETIDAVLSAYGEKNTQWLNENICLEEPYKNRKGDVINIADMHEYYSGLEDNKG